MFHSSDHASRPADASSGSCLTDKPAGDTAPEPSADAAPDTSADAMPESLADAVPEPSADAVPELLADAASEPSADAARYTQALVAPEIVTFPAGTQLQAVDRYCDPSSVSLHQIANIFPRMGDADFDALKGSIAESGQREPILAFRGALIDGKARLEICRTLGWQVWIKDLPSDTTEENALERVETLNLRRRHLSSGQRALAAGRAVMARRSRSDGANLPGTRTRQELVTEVTRLYAVGERMVGHALALLRADHPEAADLIDAVERDHIPLDVADNAVRYGMVREVLRASTSSRARLIVSRAHAERHLEERDQRQQAGTRVEVHPPATKEDLIRKKIAEIEQIYWQGNRPSRGRSRRRSRRGRDNEQSARPCELTRAACDGIVVALENALQLFKDGPPARLF